MLIFFHGWRRKVGLGTLVIALALTGLWIRSRSIHDEYSFWKRNQTSVVLASENACLVIGTVWNTTPAVILGPYLAMHRERIVSGGRIQHAADLELESRWRCCGLELVTRSQRPMLGLTNVRCTLLIVPYWLIVWPITGVSAYLLLWKSRTRAVAMRTGACCTYLSRRGMG
jgi:hypothetical protein